MPSVTGGLLNGDEMALVAFELVDDLLSPSPGRKDRLASVIREDVVPAYLDTEAWYCS
jgi:hypothetical protein